MAVTGQEGAIASGFEAVAAIGIIIIIIFAGPRLLATEFIFFGIAMPLCAMAYFQSQDCVSCYCLLY